MFRFASLGLLFVVLSLCAAFAQTVPASDPQALTYAAESIAAIVGNVSVTDVTMTGSVTWAGSDTGSVTLRALGAGESRMDLVLTSGTRTEIRDAQTGAQIGQWLAPNNASGYFASQNCWTDAGWFFPVLGSLAAGPNVVLSYLGPQIWNGQNVQAVQSYVYQSNPAGLTPSPQQLSTMNLYLDSTTLLPAALTFNAHPDNDATTNLLVEVDFSNYQTISGVVAPMHIQKYQQGNLMVDVVVTGASFDSGLSLSLFTVN
jgi:hypothetical protein